MLHAIGRNRRRALCLAATFALVAGLPAAAHANGDPPSDVLLEQDVYFPSTPPTSAGAARALLELTRRTRAAGWPIKVAIVATPADLGDVGALFARPQAYADFLVREIRVPRLLVVTPVGFGGQRLGAHVDRALSGLDPAPAGGDRLERQALTAVARLAALDGHRVPAPRIDTSARGRRPYRQAVTTHRGSPGPARPATGGGPAGKDGGGQSPLVFAAPIALAVLLLGGATLRDRLKRSSAR